jgi:hypothetical protein
MTIFEPITENYIFITFGTTITINKKIIQEITPETEIVRQLRNSNYYDFEGNSFKYMFIYKFDLHDFVNINTKNVLNAKYISHDQIRLNFRTNLIIKKNKFLSPKYILTHPKLSNKYSTQYNKSGITLGKYNDAIINGLPIIISKWPVNMSKVDNFHPKYFVTDYEYIDLEGNTTIKKSTFGAIKYIEHKCNNCKKKCPKYCKQKIIFWGTGLKEEIV